MRQAAQAGTTMLAIACVLLTIGPFAAQPAGQADTPYAATRLIGRWRAIMNNTLEESRAFAPESVIELMEVFVSPGAVRLVQDKATEEQVERADAIVERFALAVVRAGDRRPDGSVIVREADVSTAEKAVCPVYPFCP